MREYKISKQLVESFGYEQQLDEYSWQDLKGTASKAANKLAGPLLIATYIWQGYQEITALPTSLSKEQYRSAVAKIITKMIADYGLFAVGTALGGIIGGAVAGPGAIVGILTGGIAAEYLLGDSVDEIVEKIVDALYPVGKEDPNTEKIRLIQQTLQQVGYDIGPTGADGQLNNPTITALQRQLKSLGYNLGTSGPNKDGVDGVIGKLTNDAMNSLGLGLQEGTTMNEYTTIAEDIAALRDKLDLIENHRFVETTPMAATSDMVRTALTGSKKARAVKSASPVIEKEIKAGLEKLGSKPAFDAEKIATSSLGPEQMKKLADSALANPAITAAEKQAIQQGGIVAWLKNNPKKAAVIGLLSTSGIGYIANDSDHKVEPVPPTPSPLGSGHKSSYDPDVAEKQKILNDLGANIKVDGIWGPKTEAAYNEYWVKNYAYHNAITNGADEATARSNQAAWDAASQLGQSTTPTTAPQQTDNTSDSYKELTKNVPRGLDEEFNSVMKNAGLRK
jgi:hypothetical protein